MAETSTAETKRWRTEQSRILLSIEEHHYTDKTYIDEGVQLLQLARKVHVLFGRQKPHQIRHLLNFVVSNSTWRDAQLTVEFRQPLNLLVVGTDSNGCRKAASSDSDGLLDNWLPIVDTFRTFCLAPTPQIRAVFESVRKLAPLWGNVPGGQ